jgi:hypothetical protein
VQVSRQEDVLNGGKTHPPHLQVPLFCALEMSETVEPIVHRYFSAHVSLETNDVTSAKPIPQPSLKVRKRLNRRPEKRDPALFVLLCRFSRSFTRLSPSDRERYLPASR